MIDEGLSQLIYGAVGGGLVALIWKTVDTYVIGVRLGESVEARKKLRAYARPLWLECRELRFRMTQIRDKLQGDDPDGGLRALQARPPDPHDVAWYTQDGYFATSTAYLIAAVAAWIRLYQRDVVFLEFGARSATHAFFKLTEDLQRTYSARPSILWYYYFSAIGEMLVDRDVHAPLTMAQFTLRLAEDERFRAFYAQLFEFVARMGRGDYLEVVGKVIQAISDIGSFLQRHGLGAVAESAIDPT